MPVATETLRIRIDADRLGEWKLAAARQGVSLSEFVRVCVDDRLTMAEVSGARIVKPEPTRIGPGTREVRALHTPASAKASKAQAGRNRQTAARASRAAVCARQRHHRAGVYCRECGTTP